MKRIIITEQERNKILEMYNKKILTESLDYTKPIITSKKLANNKYQIWGFVNFTVTKSNLESKEVNDAIDNIISKLENEGYEATGISVLTVNGGASNYLSGAMKADFKNNPDNPVVLTTATNSLPSYPGESNRAKNLTYAQSRADVLKNALVKKFPPTEGAKLEAKGYIIDTGGVIDENRDVNSHPVPGQQATFVAELIVKKLPPQPKPANEIFKQTNTARTNGTQKGPDTNGICKILTKNTFFQQLVNLPEIGLGPFTALINKDPKNNTWTITKKDNQTFSKMEWIYVKFYLQNEMNGVHGLGACTALEHVTNIPKWVMDVDLTKVPVGARSAEYDAVNDASRHKKAS